MKSKEGEKADIAYHVTIEKPITTAISSSSISSFASISIRKSYEWANLTKNKNITNEKPNMITVETNFMRETPTFKMYVNEDEEQASFSEDELIPERIEGFYIYDYNILKVDEILRKKFNQEKKKELSLLQNRLDLEKIKVQGRQSMIERKATRKNITEYETEIAKYQENANKKAYVEKATPFLQAYKDIGPISTVVSFVSNDKEVISSKESKEEQDKRHKIISGYLEVARKYIKIDLVRNLVDTDICPGCGIDTKEIEMVEDDSDSMICQNCGLEKINIIKSAFYADGGRINNCRNNYEDRANFEKVLMRYQGKQITKPSKDLYMKLDEYFIGRGLLSSKEYNDLPLLPDGTKAGTSREMMFEILSNIGCSGYYDDINLICSVFFGWTLPDVTHLEEEIMQDYDEFQAVYDQLPDRDGRKSSLNSQWKLFILLKRRGWSCKSKDFKIPTTASILEYHRVKTKQVYSVLGWDCPY